VQVTARPTVQEQTWIGPIVWQLQAQSLNFWSPRVPLFRTQAASDAVWAVVWATAQDPSWSWPVPSPEKFSVQVSPATASVGTKTNSSAPMALFMSRVASLCDRDARLGSNLPRQQAASPLSPFLPRSLALLLLSWRLGALAALPCLRHFAVTSPGRG
jgi:hypothetical protein